MAIMKNFVKLFVVMLVAAILLGSCDLLQKGGTIIVKNDLDKANKVSIVKIDNITDLKNPKIKEAIDNLSSRGTEIKSGDQQKFTFDEDGVYVVAALLPKSGFAPPITLTAGITLTVTFDEDTDIQD